MKKRVQDITLRLMNERIGSAVLAIIERMYFQHSDRFTEHAIVEAQD
jgi:hypothetical protein